MHDARVLAVECEKMRKQLTELSVSARELYEQGKVSSDEYLDMLLEQRRLRDELNGISQKLDA